MMKHPLVLALAAVALFLFSGCLVDTTPTADPTRYFVLGLEETEIARTTGVASMDAPETQVVGIRMARFPAYLDQSRMAYREGPGEIVYLPFFRWAYPLKQGFTAGLVASLENSDAPLRAFAWPYPSGVEPDQEVTLWVSAFEPREDKELAILNLRYRVGGVIEPYSAQQPLPQADSDGARIAAGQASVLKAFADHLAMVLSQQNP